MEKVDLKYLGTRQMEDGSKMYLMSYNSELFGYHNKKLEKVELPQIEYI
jgi:hypothetical protein